MIPVKNAVMNNYEAVLKKREIPLANYADFKKWLRYYHDFCSKHAGSTGKYESVRLFLEKLKEKKQSELQRQQAAHAISLYFEMQKQVGVKEELFNKHPPVQNHASQYPPQPALYQRKSQYTVAGYQEKSDCQEWDDVLVKLAGEIKVRHYSRNTLKTYALWSRQFQRFLKNKPPQELTTADVKEYLTYLAVKCKVAASTQNQAFNSLLFLFRHALRREFGELRDVPRAKKSLYIPMVLSMPEIDAILKQLSYPFNLFVKILFGCGLRLFEGLQIRVGDFNFNAGKLLVHGKGKKDRTVPIPETILEDLKAC